PRAGLRTNAVRGSARNSFSPTMPLLWRGGGGGSTRKASPPGEPPPPAAAETRAGGGPSGAPGPGGGGAFLPGGGPGPGRAEAGPCEGVDGQAVALRRAGRLPPDAAVAPQAEHPAADFLLEAVGPLPGGPLLVAEHGGQVAGQVDHHRQVPLADGRVEDPPS